MRRWTPMLVLALAVGLLGCAGDDEAATTAVDRADDGLAGEAPADDAAPDVAEAPAEQDRAASGEDAAGPRADARAVSAALGRKVIRTAEIELRVTEPDEAVDEVLTLAERAGGFVATTDLRRDADDVLRGTVTLRVPSDDLLEVLRDLERLAVSAPVSRIDERDVTTETADLEARLTNLTTYEQELRELLADVRSETSSPDDLLRIFERIREVRAEIDQIEGRLASLSDQVDLATVTVRITPAQTATPVTDPTWQPGETLHEALGAAARGLARLVDAAIWLGVAVLPVALVVLAPVVALVVAWRRRRRPADATTPTG